MYKWASKKIQYVVGALALVAVVSAAAVFSNGSNFKGMLQIPVTEKYAAPAPTPPSVIQPTVPMSISAYKMIGLEGNNFFDPSAGGLVKFVYILDTGSATSCDHNESIFNEAGSLVIQWRFGDKTSATYSGEEWNGFDDQNHPAPAGKYRFRVDCEAGGEYVEAYSPEFTLSTSPSGYIENVKLDKGSFNPNLGEEISLAYSLNNFTANDSCDNSVIIFNEQENNIRSWKYLDQESGNFQRPDWDGKDAQGNLAPAGKYKFVVFCSWNNTQVSEESSEFTLNTDLPTTPPAPTPSPTPNPSPTPTPTPTPSPSPTPKNVSTKTTTTTTTTTTSVDPTKCAGFKDVDATDKDCKAIEYVKSIGAMTGTDGNFQPGGLLQRDQIAKIILETMDLYSENKDYCKSAGAFPDVGPSFWSYQYLCQAKLLDVVTGYKSGPDEGMYRPAANVNRAEFLALLLRSIGDEMPDAHLTFYNDVEPGTWYSAYANYSNNHGLFVGESLYPTMFVSRREVASVIFKLHEQGKI